MGEIMETDFIVDAKHRRIDLRDFLLEKILSAVINRQLRIV